MDRRTLTREMAMLHTARLSELQPQLPRPPLRLFSDGPPQGPLADLAHLYLLNTRIQAELDRARKALRAAVTYAARPDSNPLLAQARIDQIQTRRHQLLAQLRSHRVTARRLVNA